ncbi:MAG: ComEC/Rec2 family competence protein, partial [Candidatus Roizmanbacteria bacterium]
MKDIAISFINSYLPEPHASLLSGMVLGQPIPKIFILYEEIHRVGLLHLVVLSGSNIAILTAFCAILVSKFSKRIQIVLILLITSFFIYIVGIQAPILRAFIMSLFTLGAILYGRKNDTLISLGMTSLIMLLLRPEWFSEISFQLSIGATAGIIIFYQELIGLFERYLKLSRESFLNKELSTTVSAQIFTIPLIAYYFR